MLYSPANPSPELDAQLRTCDDLCPTLISPMCACAYALLVCAASTCFVKAFWSLQSDRTELRVGMAWIVMVSD